MIATGTLLLILASGASQSSSSEIRGIVVDLTGAPVPGAHVATGEARARSDATGRFTLSGSGASVTLHVTARGFEEHEREVALPSPPLRIVLSPAGLAETLTVTARRSRARLADTASAASVISAASLLTSGALMLDDSLRTVPGFSLFRRSSSRVANPTTQGASLRGLAASGASRALVLADGMPLNDPFGGWVYWNRVPISAVDRVEVVRGGATSGLYGHEAIGGVVQVFAIDPHRRSLRAVVEGGSHGYVRGSGYGGGAFSGWRAFLSGERMTYDGYPIVAAEARGPIDTPAGVRYWSALGDAAREAGGGWFAVRGGLLDEERANGTPLQENDTRLRHLAVRGSRVQGPGAWSLSAFGGDVRYHQSFSAVFTGRATESLTARQRVTSEHAGGSAQWAGLLGRNSLAIGAEARHTRGASRETRYSAGMPTDDAAGRGQQRDYAAFAQVTAQPSNRLSLTAGARAGVWMTGPPGALRDGTRSGFLMPRVAASWAASHSVSVHASWSNPGRTPTLNELYRDFRVGNTVTSANPRLAPESAHTMEAGALWRQGRMSARAVAFWTELEDAVTNVTLSTEPGLIWRERRNAGAIRARGLEFEGEWRASSRLSFTGSATAFDSRFRRSQEPGLAGKRVPQVPRWHTTVGARFVSARTVMTADWRAIGPQFDDDRNAFRLDPGRALDVYAAYAAGRVQPYLAAENLLNAVIDVGRTPVRTVGTPRSLRVGVRLALP